MRELILGFSSIGATSNSAMIAAEWYAGCLRASGAAEVQIVRDAPHLPTVVAGFPGIRRKPILQFVGYLHGGPYPPAQLIDGQIAGIGLARGMAELIVATEVARALAQDGMLPGGGLLLVAQARPTAHTGAAGGLARLIAHGVVGDAVLLADGEHAVAPIRSLGLATFRVTFTRLEPRSVPAHGQQSGAAMEAAHAFSMLLRRRSRSLARRDPQGDESIVVRRIDGGNHYDPPSHACEVEGNWQWSAGRTVRDVLRELEDLAARAALQYGACVDLNLSPRQEPCSLSPSSTLVQSLRDAHLRTVGQPLPLGTAERPDDAALFMRVGVPALGYGVRATMRENGQEMVEVAELARLARIYLHLALTYLQEECALSGIADDMPPWVLAGGREPLPAHAEQPLGSHGAGAGPAEEPSPQGIFIPSAPGSRA